MSDRWAAPPPPLGAAMACETEHPSPAEISREFFELALQGRSLEDLRAIGSHLQGRTAGLERSLAARLEQRRRLERESEDLNREIASTIALLRSEGPAAPAPSLDGASGLWGWARPPTLGAVLPGAGDGGKEEPTTLASLVQGLAAWSAAAESETSGPLAQGFSKSLSQAASTLEELGKQVEEARERWSDAWSATFAQGGGPLSTRLLAGLGQGQEQAPAQEGERWSGYTPVTLPGGGAAAGAAALTTTLGAPPVWVPQRGPDDVAAPTLARAEPEAEAVAEPGAAPNAGVPARATAVAAAAEAPAPAPAPSTSVILEAHLTLDGEELEVCRVHAEDRCREVAARYVRENSLKGCFVAPLAALLLKAEADAERFPVVLRGDLMEIREQHASGSR